MDRVVSLTGVFRRDWLQRLIEQIAEFVAKATSTSITASTSPRSIRSRAAGTRCSAFRASFVDRVEAPTLAELLREPAKMRAGAELLTIEARAYAGKGDPLHAAVCYRRAYELYAEAGAGGPDRRQLTPAILELSRISSRRARSTRATADVSSYNAGDGVYAALDHYAIDEL